MKKSHFTGIVKKSVKINASKEKAWKKISNIVGLPTWVIGVKKTTYLSKKKRGVGSIRNIVFDDGNTIEEHVVKWDDKNSFSYIAVNGLPLRSYFATISLKTVSKNTTQITWESYFNSKKTTKKAFDEFVSFLESFYEKSLDNLKSKIR